MNAYTSIGRGPKRPLSVRLRSRAYRRGLQEGFGATSLFLSDQSFHFTKDVDASVSGTWKAVGDAVKAALETKEVQIGKVSRKAELTD